MDNKVNNIEDSKTTIINSGVGKALGFTEDSSWNEIIVGISSIIDRSDTIQTCTSDTTNDNASCYRINGGDIEIIPAKGLWYNWDWAKSCVKIPSSAGSKGLLLNSSGSNKSDSYAAIKSYTLPVSGTFILNISGASSAAESRFNIRVTCGSSILIGDQGPSVMGCKQFTASKGQVITIYARNTYASAYTNYVYYSLIHLHY